MRRVRLGKARRSSRREDGGGRAGTQLFRKCKTPNFSGLKQIFGYDDALDAGVHAVCGAVGAILTGVFAVEKIGQTAGLIEGNAVQVIYQIGGVAIVLIYDGVVSLIILKLIDWTLGLRVTEDEETIGLDLTLHGEAVQ
jgi:ammonium transporter, Amt family